MASKQNVRSDRVGQARVMYEKNRKRILATQEVCGICGKPVDKSLKYPHPLSATVDHIIPVDKGGHPFDIDNLQLAHSCCNRAKSDKLVASINSDKIEQDIGNRDLPQSMDWTEYEG